MGSPPAARPTLGSIGFNLAAIAVFLAMGGMALAYGIDNLGRQHAGKTEAPATGTVVRTVGGKEIKVPRELLRYDDQPAASFSNAVDLRLVMPLGPNGANRNIDITLIPRSQARASAALLDGVYLHQFQEGELQGPPGLIGKPLKSADGFKNETVWYDALSADPFVAKCMAPVEDGGPSRCLRTVVFASIAAVYAFDADVLGSWRAFDPAIERVLGRMDIRRPVS
jgi:hypothetical protein